MPTRRLYRDDFSAPAPGAGAERVAPSDADASLAAALVGVAQSATNLVKAQLTTSGRKIFIVSIVGFTTAVLGLIGLGFLIFAIYDAFVYAWAMFGIDDLAVTFLAKLATSIVVALATWTMVMVLRSVIEHPKSSRQG